MNQINEIQGRIHKCRDCGKYIQYHHDLESTYIAECCGMIYKYKRCQHTSTVEKAKEK